MPPAPASPAPPAEALQTLEATLRPLWLRAQAGDEGAYRQALSDIASRLRGYFRKRLLTTPDEVEDLVQETLLALHLQRASYDGSSPVTAWVHAIARYKLVDHWRRHGHRLATHDDLDAVDESELVATPDGAEAQRDLLQLMQHLPEAQRAAIVLTKIEGLSVTEAAEQTGCTESAVKVQVHRGLKRLSELVRSAGLRGTA